MPTPAFRDAAFAQRATADAFWLRTTDPAQALVNLAERDRIFTDELARACARAGVDVMRIDGSCAIEDTAVQLAARFELSC